ncbi:unnamed protein product [Heterobilharzia americana]|nr:unnamed protein product [Heterobilharzia americana]
MLHVELLVFIRKQNFNLVSSYKMIEKITKAESYENFIQYTFDLVNELWEPLINSVQSNHEWNLSPEINTSLANHGCII